MDKNLIKSSSGGPVSWRLMATALLTMAIAVLPLLGWANIGGIVEQEQQNILDALEKIIGGIGILLVVWSKVRDVKSQSPGQK